MSDLLWFGRAARGRWQTVVGGPDFSLAIRNTVGPLHLDILHDDACPFIAEKPGDCACEAVIRLYSVSPEEFGDRAASIGVAAR